MFYYFIAVFVFNTGDLKDIKEDRLVRVDTDVPETPKEELLAIAHTKAKKFFEEEFPESELMSLRVHPTIV
jgi:hypothetical protein